MSMANQTEINLWLDDIRPAPEGWVWVKTVKEAIAEMENEATTTVNMSLDHDLGPCDDCANDYFGSWQQNYLEQFTCTHNGTGYQFVCWMEENDCWPVNKPTVHSANPVGRARMQQVIDKEWNSRK